MAKYNRKKMLRVKHKRIRASVIGTNERPRLSIHYSGRHIYAQIINDECGKTLVSASTTEEALRSEHTKANSITSDKVGQLIGQRAIASNISQVVFDRGGFKYHGKVKVLADAVRSVGIKF